jgi:hypothetical protein
MKHRNMARALMIDLISEGRTVAEEVGIPGGRLDVVALDDERQIEEIFEIKSGPKCDVGISQLERYGRTTAISRLTLVVLEEHASTELEQAAQAAGIQLRVQAADFSPNELDWERVVFLPYIHPDSIAPERRARARA